MRRYKYTKTGEYIYPNRHELLEYLSNEARAFLTKAHASQESKEQFCAELTTLILAP